MKKKTMYLVGFVFLIFILPAICTKANVKDDNVDNGNKDINQNIQDENTNEKISKEEKHNYSKYGTIKLLHKDTEEIEEIPIDEYLYGVVSAEMPVKYEIEALKAQAISARTYTIYQIEHNENKHEGADICDDSKCCQAWISKEDRFARWKEEERENNWEKIKQAVDETSGKIMTYNGEVIDAFFHSNSGGKTETVSNVWGGQNLPYLQSVETASENEYEEYSSEVIVSKDELLNKLKEKYEDIQIDFDKEDEIKILEHTESRKS